MTPNDWQVRRLGQVVEFLDGQRRPVKSGDRVKMAGIYPYYGASGIVDYVNDYIFDEDLILLGEDGENILSRNLRFAFRVSGKVWVNNHAHVLRSKSGVEIGYLVEYLESLDYEQYNSGTAQPKLNKQTCFGIPVAVPPLPEQRAIAEALSDVDGLLGALEALIAKKRAIKQAAMQQLLTGKTRLPGFSGEWETKRIRDITKIPVTDGPHLTPKFLSEGIPFLSVNNLSHNRVDTADLRYISLDDHHEFSKKCKPQKWDVLLGKAASVGKVAIVDFDWEFNIWSPIALIRPDEQGVPHFVYFNLQTSHVIKQIEYFTNSSSQGNIGMTDIGKLEFFMPLPDEQQAIATVLSDMDAEIAALEHRRDKTKQIKRGMMQQLLTGRVRLV